MKTVALAILTVLSVPSAFASARVNCVGHLGRAIVRASVVTAADDVGGEGDLTVSISESGRRPSRHVFSVMGIDNRDSDSDVSYKYQAKENPRVVIKVNDNPAMGASYLLGFAGRKIALSCK